MPVGDVLLEDLGATPRAPARRGRCSPPAWFSMNAQRVRQLADVVVVGGDARQQRVGADRLGGPLGQVADHQRVVVGPGVSRRSRRSSGCDGLASSRSWKTVRMPKRLPTTWKRADRGDRRADRRPPARRPTAGGCRSGRASPSSEKIDDDDDVGDDDREPGLQEDADAVAAPDGDDPGHAADEDVGRELQRDAVRRPRRGWPAWP